MNIKKVSSENALIKLQLFIAIGLWIYIIYRAVALPITQDEAHSYLLVKTNNWNQLAGTANTHWLNSLFMEVFLWLPGPDETWKLRMLSMLAWPAYVFGVIRLGALLKYRWLTVLFFVLAVANPFLVFYFSIGRGYAAACAFTMLALWAASSVITKNEYDPSKWFKVFLFASLAALSNFSAFYFFLALLLVYFFILVMNGKHTSLFRKSSLPLIIAVIVFSLFSVVSLFIMRKFNTLYFGGGNSLVDSFFGSMVKSFSGADRKTDDYMEKGAQSLLTDELAAGEQLGGWLLFIFIMAAIIFSITRIMKNRSADFSSFVFMILLMVMLFNLIFHALFSTPFLLERTALFIYPVIITGFAFMSSEARLVKERFKAAIQFFLVLATALLIYNFSQSFSIRRFKEWPVQTDTKKGLDYLALKKAEKVGLDVWHHDVLVNYYLPAFPGRYPFEVKVLPANPGISNLETVEFDHLFLLPPYHDSLMKGWRIEMVFPLSGARLYSKILKEEY